MLREKMQAIIAEVNTCVAERGELIECIAIALLTKKNLFILGETGQAKSYAINEFRKRITDARQFERLLSKQTDEEALFGRIDLKSLIDGHPRMITTGKIPDSEIIFLDEIFKSNEGVLNSLLTALNERRYTNESETVSIPAISFMSASNEIPNFNDPAEAILKPLYDRFELKVVTQYIDSREERLKMLRQKQTKQNGGVSATTDLLNLYAMQDEVAQVTIPDAVNELMDDVLCELRRQGIHISDRKYLNYYPIAQAKAWLEGRAEVQYSDLMALKNYLWTKPEEAETIGKTLERLCVNPIQEKLRGVISMANEGYDEFLANDGDSRALRKLRSELLRLYAMVRETDAADTLTDTEHAAVAFVSDRLEVLSKQGHERAGFTYTPLAELEKLQ